MYRSDINKIWVAGDHIYLNPKMCNRHGLITGATGTGKTISLKVITEGLSDMGVPVFLADVKGDLSGYLQPVDMNENVTSRVEKLGVDGFAPSTYPATFFDVYGRNGINMRATISDVGPTLLARLLELNDTQSGVLQIIFKVADDAGWLLLDIKDLRSMIQYVTEHRDEVSKEYGNIAPQTTAAILRQLLHLEEEGADFFFGEPTMDIEDWFKVDANGKGMINILNSADLFLHPRLYGTVMLWLLNSLYETLPECGDLDKPKMVFFFDEAHVLFDGAPKALVEKVEQVIKLIRSKGVGIFFITQNPADIPDAVLAQLGNRLQHALRAYTPKEQKAVKAAAQSFRTNPEFNTMEVITQLGTGEALVSFLDDEGIPQIVQRAKVLPPQSCMGKCDDYLVNATIEASPLKVKYANVEDRYSAYEIIQERLEEEEAEDTKSSKKGKSLFEKTLSNSISTFGRETANDVISAAMGKKRNTKKSPFEKAISSATSTVGRELGSTLSRGLMGIFKK